ncbi:hypothetical protein T4D_899 [Trichinella pseudospiralis]|uniref:Uncharacterized protein n=1 Tax=Trichinella pseudospiralis TaxID=6337 RepID=A0A0V1FMH4_TRIPS|nr:hypothetical protein T4D_899 [Trichinella pseudospiralis]
MESLEMTYCKLFGGRRGSKVGKLELSGSKRIDCGWLLATGILEPTRGYPVSHCTASRSVINLRARRSLMIHWGSGSKPPRNEPR